MALHISNQKANRLARKLARQMGETLTDAVIRALEERLENNDLRGRENRQARKAAILDVVREFGALPVLDDRPADEILGYDETGLPS